MYTPSSFRVTDPSLTNAFIREHSFGLLLTTEGGRIHDTHTPLLLSDDERYLCGHIAKANPQWKSWDQSSTATVIFTGPHSYISPSYYASEFNVPTWNYTAVTVRGPISILSEEDQVVKFIDSLVSQYEDERSIPWFLDHSDHKYMQLLSSIVAFQIEVAEVEAIGVQPPEDYSGTWVIWRVNGCKRHEIGYRHGKYHGPLVFFYDNEKVSVRQHYTDGVCSGIDSGWYSDGRKKYQGTYLDGKQHGIWTHWYPDGSLRCRDEYSAGKQHGTSAAWHKDGKKTREVSYQNGKKHGRDRVWNDSGKLLWSRNYENGELIR